MIRFTEENGALIAQSRNETIRIEGGATMLFV